MTYGLLPKFGRAGYNCHMAQHSPSHSSSIPTWTLGDRLAKALDHSGVSVADMADELGVSRNTVGNYIAGRTAPKRAVVAAWALLTGVPRDWLLTGDVDLTGRDPNEGVVDRRGRPDVAPTRNTWMASVTSIAA